MRMCLRLMICLTCLLLSSLSPQALRAAETPAAILEHTRSVYGALTSYADTGAVTKQYSATSQDKYTFVTRFNRAPRHFMFDFSKPGGDRLVIWGDPDAFHAWWKTTGQVNDYPNPKNSSAITLNDFPTSGSITKIAPLLYPKGGLPGSIAQFVPSRLAGMEQVAGSNCYKVEGSAGDSYGATGHTVNVRTITVWIDSTSYLVRKILEESPAAPGMLNRITTEFDPQANPKLSDDVFQFAPPR